VTPGHWGKGDPDTVKPAPHAKTMASKGGALVHLDILISVPFRVWALCVHMNVNTALEYLLERFTPISWQGVQLGHCTAWELECYLDDTEHGELWYALKSYNTIVALYNPYTDTVYVLGYWSATSCKHIAKWIEKLDAQHVYYLYKRSDHTGYYNRFTHERTTYTNTQVTI
jgi:hypothetical protein